MQDKPEELGSFLNPSYSDPEITDVQEALKYAAIFKESPEAHPLLKTPPMVEFVDEVALPKITSDASIVEHMADDGQSFQTFSNKMTEHMSAHYPTHRNMVDKDGPPLQSPTENVIDHVSGYRPTDQSMMEHMAKVGPPLQTTNENMTESGYRPQIRPQSSLQSPDTYCSPFHLMDLQREALRLGSSTDGLDTNDSFQLDFTLFQGMDLQVVNDGAPEDDSTSIHVTTTMTAWTELHKCSQITGMGNILSSQLICHLPADRGELQDANPYFPHIYARGT